MIRVGLILCVIAALAAVPLLDEGAREWLAENTTCNERPCTEDEIRDLSITLTAGAGGVGVILLLVGIVRAGRRGIAGPDLGELTADGQDERMEALARLDEAYGRGDLNDERYRQARDRLMGGGSGLRR